MRLAAAAAHSDPTHPLLRTLPHLPLHSPAASPHHHRADSAATRFPPTQAQECAGQSSQIQVDGRCKILLIGGIIFLVIWLQPVRKSRSTRLQEMEPIWSSLYTDDGVNTMGNIQLLGICVDPPGGSNWIINVGDYVDSFTALGSSDPWEVRLEL